MIKKKPFLLLEVLIAFSLATLCLVPLVRHPIRMYKKEICNLELVEKERLANLVFCEIKEKLLKKEFSWDQIPEKGVESPFFHLSSVSLQLPGWEKKIECKYQFIGKGEKQGHNGEIFRKTNVKIVLDKQIYLYTLFVQLHFTVS